MLTGTVSRGERQSPGADSTAKGGQRLRADLQPRGETQNRLLSPQRNKPFQDLDSGLPVSRTVRQYISAQARRSASMAAALESDPAL